MYDAKNSCIVVRVFTFYMLQGCKRRAIPFACYNEQWKHSEDWTQGRTRKALNLGRPADN